MSALFRLPTTQTRGAGRSPAAVVRDDDDEWGRWFINSWTALMSKERRLKFAAPHASPAHDSPEGSSIANLIVAEGVSSKIW
jgi:hypothetical protein